MDPRLLLAAATNDGFADLMASRSSAFSSGQLYLSAELRLLLAVLGALLGGLEDLGGMWTMPMALGESRLLPATG